VIGSWNPYSRITLLLIPLILTLLVGCEDDVAGPAGVDEPFSMYGIINPRLKQQTLLVSPIEDLLYPLDSSIDAEVTSTDLTTGNEYAWKDSVVANETGQLDHVFWAEFRPEFGSRHRIEVVRSDGEVTSVVAEVPATVTIEEEDSGTRFHEVTTYGEAIRLIRVDVLYGVRGYIIGQDSLGPYSTYTFSRTGEQEKVEGGWRVTVNLNTDYEPMRSLYFLDHGWILSNPACAGLGLFDLTISLTIGSEDWNPPGGTFDPNVLVQPGTLTNVENGFGFVAGGYNEEHALYPSTVTLDETGFFDFIDGRTPEVRGCGQYVGS
jgi:hypothetical protein